MMLNDTQMQQLQALLQDLRHDQRLWLSGYLQGRLETGHAADGECGALPASARAGKLKIFYATETGNGKALALSAQKAFRTAGFTVSNSSVNRLTPADLAKAERAVFICSTHGEGDPPEASRRFFAALETAGENFSALSYTVLGLGDSIYASFCGAALRLDELLRKGGARQLAPPRLLDLDYQAHVPHWLQATVGLFGGGGGAPVTAVPARPAESLHGTSRLNPVRATVKCSINLNDTGSDRETRHLELVPEVPLAYTPGDSVGIMLDGDPDPPRLYSIASAPSAHPGEIHLVVVLAKYVREDGTLGYGKCSRYMCDLKAGDNVSLYVHANRLFNLPGTDQDAIMIGPGTGVAPFRSFVYERLEQGHTGRSWLLFGNPHQQCDFLYQSEWQEHMATGGLHKISLAFSRDSTEKVYVQHRLLEEADTLRSWVEGGAVIYVCGARDTMSVGVEQALSALLGNERLEALEESARYIKEVY